MPATRAVTCCTAIKQLSLSEKGLNDRISSQIWVAHAGMSDPVPLTSEVL